MSDKHTPTPWSVGRADYGARYVYAATEDEPGEVARMIAEPVEANARLIVRAVNSHAALVEALRETQAWIHEYICSAVVCPAKCQEPCVQARAALAAAEGE